MEVPLKYPIAWYLTWTTYGTWLHGDDRGSHTRKHYLPPNPLLQEKMSLAMTDDAVYLSDPQRELVDAILAKECLEQGWFLHERNVRTNHVHAVVTAAKDGKLVRSRFKAIASAALSDQAGLAMAGSDGRRRWWTEKGNVIPVESERALLAINTYVRDLQ